MSHILRTLAATALLSSLACGGGDGGPSYAGSVDAATATAAANEAAYYASDLSEAILHWGYSTSMPSVRGTSTPSAAEQWIARVRARAYGRAGRTDLAGSPSPFRVAGVCTPTETGVDEFGTPIDTDDDGIPNDYKVTFGSSCVDVEGDYTTTYSGSLRIRDVGAFYGYRIDAANLKIRFAHLTDYEQVSINGVETGTFAAALITHTLDADYGMSYSYTTPAVEGLMLVPTVGSTTFGINSSSTFDPSSDITLGGSIPGGVFTFTVDYSFGVSGAEGSGNYHFNVATDPSLGIQAASCYGPISGAIDGDLNGDVDVGFHVVWTSCDNFTVTTRGTTVPTGSVRR